MAVQKSQADVLVNRLHYELPRWDGTGGERDAQEGTVSFAGPGASPERQAQTTGRPRC
jgi:50S ribosomal subunit-associated GTPase HflX